MDKQRTKRGPGENEKPRSPCKYMGFGAKSLVRMTGLEPDKSLFSPFPHVSNLLRFQRMGHLNRTISPQKFEWDFRASKGQAKDNKQGSQWRNTVGLLLFVQGAEFEKYLSFIMNNIRFCMNIYPFALYLFAPGRIRTSQEFGAKSIKMLSIQKK